MTPEDARILADLVRQPGWGILKKMLAERREREIRSLGARMFKGEVPADAADVRAFHRQADWFLQQADNAFAQIEEGGPE